MKKVLILSIALLLFALNGCTGDCGIISPKAEHDCTEAFKTVPETTELHTYSPANTYAILKDEHDRIAEYLKNYACGDLISSLYIDYENSVIVVGLKELNDENIEFFKENISDKDFIVFEEVGNIVFTTE